MLSVSHIPNEKTTNFDEFVEYFKFDVSRLSHLLRFVDIFKDSVFNLNKKVDVLIFLIGKNFFLIENNKS